MEKVKDSRKKQWIDTLSEELRGKIRTISKEYDAISLEDALPGGPGIPGILEDAVQAITKLRLVNLDMLKDPDDEKEKELTEIIEGYAAEDTN